MKKLWFVLIGLLLAVNFVSERGISGGAASNERSERPQGARLLAVIQKKEQALRAILYRYRTNLGGEMALSKKIISAFGGANSKTSKGRFFLSKGKFRIELGDKLKSVLLMNEKEVYSIIDTPKELGGKPQITRISFNQASRKDNPVYWFLVGDERIWKEFHIVENSYPPLKSYEIVLEPRQEGKYLEFSKIKFSLKGDMDAVEALSFWDDLGSVTTYKFSIPKWDQKLDAKLFHYQPKKGDQVTDI